MTPATKAPPTQAQKRQLKVEAIQPITDPGLISYLRGRGIPPDLAELYVSQAALTLNGSGVIPVLVLRNDRGGHAIRAEYWQAATGPEYHTTINGGTTGRVAVFEGMFDYLSALVFSYRKQLASDVIVLNSTAHVDGALDLLKQYRGVDLYLDNDSAGRGRTLAIQQACSNVVNHSGKLYPEHKDFNLFLTKEHLRLG